MTARRAQSVREDTALRAITTVAPNNSVQDVCLHVGSEAANQKAVLLHNDRSAQHLLARLPTAPAQVDCNVCGINR
jgi:hypothetical protein